MPRKQRLTWTVVFWLAVVVTGFACLVVLGGGTAVWLVEGERPDSTIHTWGDALWWSLTTLTTVGYGDHVPVTTTGRLIAAGVMVAGVAVIGAVAAIVALACGSPSSRSRGGAGIRSSSRNPGAARRCAPRSDRGTAGWFGCSRASVAGCLSR
jgi:voltage-gated potassium channel Kch